MRRAQTRSALPSVLLGALAILALGAGHASADAGARATFRARFVPIPTFKHTGNLLGAGTAVELMFEFAATDPGPSTPPLEHVQVELPTIANGTFARATCETEATDYAGCPAGSHAGAATVVQVSGTPTSGHVAEPVSLAPVFTPGGGFTFLRTQVNLEPLPLFSIAGALTPQAKGSLIDLVVPLLEPAPGHGNVSFESLVLKLGAAVKVKTATRAVTRSLLTVPKKCPVGGWPATAAMTFAAPGGEEVIDAQARIPCPPRPPSTGPAPAPACRSQRDFTIHIPRRRSYTHVWVYLDGRSVPVVYGHSISAQIDLRGLPKGSYVVRIVISTRSGHKLVQTRTFETCTASTGAAS